MNFENIKPLKDLVLVKIERESEVKSDSGILLKMTKSAVDDREMIGEIVAVGPDSKLKVGTKILFEKYAGIDLDDELTMLRNETILGYFYE
jgi:chaperonin 10 Kd subunit|nr:MAG TPA: chaperonin [Caudoviricetes sp.]